MDKKRMRSSIHYVLLKAIGKGVLQELEFKQLEKLLQKLVKA
jgi:3-dehydroquinate synthetase